MQTEQDPENPNPTYIEAANDAAQRLAEKMGGLAQSSLFEALANIPTTAHILGGAVIGRDPEHGVIDADGRNFGYQNLLVTDRPAIPANPGVDPSLTITALAERTLSTVPAKRGAQLPWPVVPTKAPWPGPKIRLCDRNGADTVAPREAPGR